MPLKKEGGRKKKGELVFPVTCVHSHRQCLLFHLQTISSLFCLLMTEGIPARYTGSSPTSKEVRLQRQAPSRQNEMQEGKAPRSRSQGEVTRKGKAQNMPEGIKIRINPVPALSVPPGLVHGSGDSQVIWDAPVPPASGSTRPKPFMGEHTRTAFRSLLPKDACAGGCRSCKPGDCAPRRRCRLEVMVFSGLNSDWK